MLADLRAVLDLLAIAVVLCDETGLVIFANEKAELFGSAGYGIAFSSVSLTTRKLIAFTSSQRQAFGTLIRTAANAELDGGMRLDCRLDGQSALALVTPMIQKGAQRSAHNVLVTVGHDSSPTPTMERRLRMLFGLSPTQASLTVAIFNGISLSEFAALRKNKLSTVRSQLARVFAKTGVRTQIDLIRLLYTLPQVDRPLQRRAKQGHMGRDFNI